MADKKTHNRSDRSELPNAFPTRKARPEVKKSTKSSGHKNSYKPTLNDNNISDTSSKSAKNKKRKKKKNPIIKVLKVIGATLLSLFLILVITGSIVTTALTIYIMKFAENDDYEMSIDDLKLGYTTMIYATESDGTEVEVKRLYDTANRIWVDIEQIPQYTQDAFICAEDERFDSHQGVDWKRTFGAFANMFLNYWDTSQGGSTITQQLIKNVTGDDATEGSDGISRKVREIFRAIQLEKNYTKPEILEAYLNYIGLNNGQVCGVQAASAYYFNKDVSEITIAESAMLAALPKNPVMLDPFYYPEKNRERQLYVLKKMYDNGVIDYDQYQQAVNEEIVLYYDDENSILNNQTAEEKSERIEKLSKSYYIDAVIDQVSQDLAKKYDISVSEAETRLKNSGYRIYSNVDIDLQQKIESKYTDFSLVSGYNLDEYPQSAFVCMNYDGSVKAIVGGIGEKATRGFNRATMAKRPPGSTIKPVAAYGPAIEMNLITWSTMIKDSKLMNVVQNGKSQPWPYNYSRTFANYNIPVYMALQRSLNTIPAKIIDQMGVQTSFDFMTQTLGYTTLVDSRKNDQGVYLSDIDYAPLTLGALTDGVILMEHCAAYAVYGNGGTYYVPKTYSKVVNSFGEIILEQSSEGSYAVSEETSWVMNRMLKTVVDGPYGTGKKAKLSNVELVAKTGTSDEHSDYLFVGLTPDYVTAMWMGYDTPKSMQNKTYDSSTVWKNIFGETADSSSNTKFKKCETVVEAYFCTSSGLLAKSSCPGTSLGYYKSDNVPGYCKNH